jgi:ATP/maltotriose-dependent transcriptional regulator MalT
LPATFRPDRRHVAVTGQGARASGALFDSHDGAPRAQHGRPSYDALKELGETSHFSTITHALGTALYLQGRFAEADALTRECEEACRPNDVHSAILWRSTRAKILARTGSIAEAERLGREGVALAATSDFLLAHAQASLDLAEVLTVARKTAAAAASAEEADRLFALKGVRRDIGRAWAG